MNTVKNCLSCGRWFAPIRADDLLCDLCNKRNNCDESRVVKWWWIAFALAMLGAVISLFL